MHELTSLGSNSWSAIPGCVGTAALKNGTKQLLYLRLSLKFPELLVARSRV